MSQLTFSDVSTRRVRPGPSRDDGGRLGICALALFLGLLLAWVPIPLVTTNSVTQTVITIVSPPMPSYDGPMRSGSGFGTYVVISLNIGLTVALPTLIYQGLALAGPVELGEQRRLRTVVAYGLSVLFFIGMVVAQVWVLPTAISLFLTYGSSNNIPGLEVRWSLVKYLTTATGLTYLLGIGFQLPFWPTVLVRLGITRLRTLQRSRRYVLLAAVIAAGMVTPSTDLLSMTLVAAPLYLLYEIGLLVARVLPARD